MPTMRRPTIQRKRFIIIDSDDEEEERIQERTHKRPKIWREVIDVSDSGNDGSMVSSGNDWCDANEEDRDLKDQNSVSDGIAAGDLPLLPLEITHYVPCQLCGKLFKSYLRATSHAMLYCQKKNDTIKFVCPWKNIAGCKRIFKTRGLAANHFKSHTSDTRTPHSCRRLCGKRFPDYYLLTTHEDKCRKDKRNKGKEQRRVTRIPLEDGMPSIMIVARSSNKAPKQWYQGEEKLVDGLPSWIEPQLADYRRIFNDKRPAVLNAGHLMKTMVYPAPKTREEAENPGNPQYVRDHKRISHEFTRNITDDLEATKENDPVVISIGADGWGCKLTLIKAYLERIPPFRLIIRFPFIEDHDILLSEEYLTKDRDVWWGEYKSDAILRRLTVGSSDGVAVDELVSYWAHIQTRKDSASKNSLKVGRNGQAGKAKSSPLAIAMLLVGGKLGVFSISER
jgi:hypothetical protein